MIELTDNKSHDENAGLSPVTVLFQILACFCGILFLYIDNDHGGPILFAGIALCLFGLLWSWKIGRFPFGRTLASGAFILILVYNFYQLPPPIEQLNLRGEASSFSNADFTIHGIRPRMSREQIEDLLGPGKAVDDYWSYQDDGVRVFYAGNACWQVEGRELWDGERTLLKSGAPISKVEALFGIGDRNDPYSYSAADPDIRVVVEDGFVKVIRLE